MSLERLVNKDSLDRQGLKDLEDRLDLRDCPDHLEQLANLDREEDPDSADAKDQLENQVFLEPRERLDLRDSRAGLEKEETEENPVDLETKASEVYLGHLDSPELLDQSDNLVSTLKLYDISRCGGQSNMKYNKLDTGVLLSD